MASHGFSTHGLHHRLPPIRYRTAGGRPLVGMVLLMFATAVAFLVGAWHAGLDRSVGAIAIGCAVAGLCAGIRQFHRSPPVDLHFDGQRWLEPDGRADAGWIVRVDLGDAMLLERRTRARPRWVWVHSRSDPSAWLALRRAVHHPPHDEVADA